MIVQLSSGLLEVCLHHVSDILVETKVAEKDVDRLDYVRMNFFHCFMLLMVFSINCEACTFFGFWCVVAMNIFVCM